MSYGTMPYAILLLVLFLILLEVRGQRSAANARAIALHITGSVIPMLELRGYSVERKQVSFGRSPYASFNISSEQGIWIDIVVDEERGYFALSNMNRVNGEPLRLSHSFEICGPWDELTSSRLVSFEKDFRTWRLNGCRMGEWQTKPDDHVLYYAPSLCHYVHPGHGARSPTDIGYKLAKQMDEASPSERYPLVPRLPRA